MNRFYGCDWQKSIPRKGAFDETCQGCVPLAFHICIESTGFEDAIRRAVCHGGDSDTLGAIVRGLAEAMYGVPAEMQAKALSYLTPQLLAVVTGFEEKFGNK